MKSKNIKKSDDVSIEDIDNRIDKINKKISLFGIIVVNLHSNQCVL